MRLPPLLPALPLLALGCASHGPGEAAAASGLLRQEDGITAVGFSPDGSVVASGDLSGNLAAWDTATGARLWEVPAHRGAVRTVAISPDGGLVVTVGEDCAVVARRIADGGTAWSAEFPAAGMYATNPVAFAPDGAWVAVAGIDADVHLLATRDGSPGRTRATEGTSALCYSADGKRLFAGSWSGVVAVFDIEDRAPPVRWVQPGVFRGSGLGVTCLALGPDGTLLADGGEDGTVRLWETADGKLRRAFPGAGAGAVAVGFLDGGRRLAAAFADGTLALREIDGAEWFPVHALGDGVLEDAAIDPVRGIAAAGRRSGRVRLLDLATGAEFPGPGAVGE